MSHPVSRRRGLGWRGGLRRALRRGWLAAAGQISGAELSRTFNCGVGMIAVVDERDADAAAAALTAAGERVTEIGRVAPRGNDASPVRIEGLEAWRG